MTSWYMVLIILSFLTLLLSFIKWRLNRHHLYKLAARVSAVEGIPMLPIIGHAMSFIGDTERILTTLRIISGKPAAPRKMWLGYKLFFMINRAEDLEIVTNSTKCLSKDDLYKMTIPLTGEGLFASPVPKWRSHRKVIMPTFGRRILDNFVEVFSKQADIFVEQLESTSGRLIDVYNYANKYSLDAVCETAMGISINAQTKESNIEHAINKVMDILMVRMACLPYHFDWIYNLTSRSREERKYVDLFGKFILDVIEKKLANYKNYKRQINEDKDTANSREPKGRYAFLDQLIELSENGEYWTTEEIKAEVSTFMIAGSDTGATVSSFIMVLLGMHTEIQQKCYEETVKVLGADRKLEYTDLPKLVYLEKVIKESMRLFPIGPVILRKVDEDMEVGGFILPKGASLILGIMGIHYSDLYYDDPWKFDPERFSPEEIAKRHKYAYLPFSAGPRNCIGMAYGMMSLKTLLAVTIRRYRMETVYKDIREIRVKQAIIIKAVDGFPVRFIPRK